jgi:hypothetical protein
VVASVIYRGFSAGFRRSKWLQVIYIEGFRQVFGVNGDAGNTTGSAGPLAVPVLASGTIVHRHNLVARTVTLLRRDIPRVISLSFFKNGASAASSASR